MKSIIKIGRDSSNDIVINEPRVSRTHAIITDHGDGTFEVKDLGSTNGTFINGKRITVQNIREGDKLEVAESIVNWYAAFVNQQETKQISVIQEEAFAKILKTITVGSSPENDIVIPDNFISSHHAKISILKNGNYFIQDLGSRNSTFVNGAKVQSKNFTKTDVVKVAATDLPQNWFLHNNLQSHFFRENKKLLIVTLSCLIIAACAMLYYFNSCKWFECRCDISIGKIMKKYKNSIVHIEHNYYYTIEYKEKIYYVGFNKDFKVIEANTSKENLLPYGSIKGSGCFVNESGTILTSALITNPWLFNEDEKNKMLEEVVKSKTIDKFSLKENYTVCGATGELKWLANGSVNNPQNYVTATTTHECVISDSMCITIQSVKKPVNIALVDYYYGEKSKEYMHKTDGYYYSSVIPLNDNVIMKDTFYFAKDTFDINVISPVQVNATLPALEEGSTVLNHRGELVGIVQKNKIIFLPNFYKQIKH